MKRIGALLLMGVMLLAACAGAAENDAAANPGDAAQVLNLANNENQEWTYDAGADAWVLSVVSYVARPLVPENQGVSVCVPGAYVAGIDTDHDGTADVTAAEAELPVHGGLVVDAQARVTSSNGQVYTASTAPVLFETGGSGYSAQANRTAGTTYAADGIIYMVAGNRGKQSVAAGEDGSTFYTGDAPDMVVDGKAAIRFLRYNIALGNLPGSSELLVVTGGSGAGAHTMMLASTGDHPVFYDYLEEIGAAGIRRGEDGALCSDISDAVWGALGYSPITSLAEADMALAFEYTLDATYDFNTPFQKQLAAALSQEYMAYINAQGLTVEEAAVGLDLDADGALASTVALTIECDPDAFPETNGYHGTYLDLYLAEFTRSLQSYLDRLGYAEGWTWFDEAGLPMTDEAVSAMTNADRVSAFLEGRVAAASARGAGMDGMRGGMRGGAPGEAPDGRGPGAGAREGLPPLGAVTDTAGNAVEVGTPERGSTQAAGSRTDSASYATYEDMLAAYERDVSAVQAGDEHGNPQVLLYDPLHFIGDEAVTLPVWTRCMNGAAEGDIAMFNSLNLWLRLLGEGVDAEIEWQWNGGHVPSEILGDSVVLRIDEMVGRYVEGAVPVEKPQPAPQTKNGTAEQATGSDVTPWVSLNADGQASFSLADIAAYRTAGAQKAMPAFDVIDYGQEDYVFGDAQTDARHWSETVLRALREQADVLAPLFNAP